MTAIFGLWNRTWNDDATQIKSDLKRIGPLGRFADQTGPQCTALHDWIQRVSAFRRRRKCLAGDILADESFINAIFSRAGFYSSADARPVAPKKVPSNNTTLESKIDCSQLFKFHFVDRASKLLAQTVSCLLWREPNSQMDEPKMRRQIVQFGELIFLKQNSFVPQKKLIKNDSVIGLCVRSGICLELHRWNWRGFLAKVKSEEVINWLCAFVSFGWRPFRAH